jgi:hypothetical protein
MSAYSRPARERALPAHSSYVTRIAAAATTPKARPPEQPHHGDLTVAEIGSQDHAEDDEVRRRVEMSASTLRQPASTRWPARPGNPPDTLKAWLAHLPRDGSRRRPARTRAGWCSPSGRWFSWACSLPSRSRSASWSGQPGRRRCRHSRSRRGKLDLLAGVRGQRALHGHSSDRAGAGRRHARRAVSARLRTRHWRH